MWEDETENIAKKNHILMIIIAVLVAIIAITVLIVHSSTAAQDAQLSLIQNQQQLAQTEARQESVAAIEAEYDKDMAVVADYLPGIVCWGDTQTSGTSSGVSYPYVLQQYINAYISDIYDFRSTISDADDYSRLSWNDYTVSIPVVNMGAGDETTSTVLGRCGAVPFVTDTAFYIPETATPVTIKIVSENGDEVNPLTGGSAGINNAEIDGIEGTLAINTSSYSHSGVVSYTFTRLTEGEKVYIPAGTVIKTAATDQYTNYIHIVCIGTYGGFDTVDELVQQTKELLSRQSQNSERFIVLGPCTISGYDDDTYMLEAIDTAMLQAFGNQYINVRKYLSGDGFTDAGITKTSADIEAIAENQVPPSFLATTNGVELNGTANRVIGKLIFNRMNSLGYFDEVNAELGITETTKQILKENPSYFDNIIKNSIN